MFEIKIFLANLIYLPIVALFAYLKLDTEAVVILCNLIIIDYLIGIVKAVYFNVFRYRAMISGVFAKILVLCIPITLAFMFKGLKLLDIFGGYVNTIISILIVAETISILINIISINQGQEIDKPDFVNIVMIKIRNFIEKILKIFI